MPTYEYECEKCKYLFDVFQKMTDEPVALCPKCGFKATRLIGKGSGIIFKGSGFYATDYKNKKGSPESNPCPKASECANCPGNKENKKKK